MNIKKFLLPSLLVGAALALIPRVAAKPASAKPASDSAAYDALDAHIEDQMQRLNIPGVSLAIVEGDQIVHLRGFGQARPGGEAPSPQTPFIIGSVTKSFTALAVMQLVEAGQVELDAPVQRYLPWFTLADSQAAAQITVRHLLNQTGGLPQLPGMIGLADFDASPGATERQARALATLELTRPVGAAFEYSNVNFNLLGLIVEAASGQSYADYIQTHVFTPLGMSHSYTSQAMARQNGLAVGHLFVFGYPLAVPNLPMPSGSLPSGQLIASAEDMGHYLIAQLNQGRYGDAQILSPDGIAELHRPAVEADEMGVPMGHYGMGWYIQTVDQTRLIWHSGIVPDFFTYMALLPEQNKAVVMLVSANHVMMNLALTDLGMGVATQLAGRQPAPNGFGFMPWALRAMLLIPLLQVAGVAATLRLLRRWRRDPALRPSGGRLWGLHILLPLIPNLALAAVPVYLLASRMAGFISLFMPDFSGIAFLSGGFAGIWAFLRTGLILRAVQSPSSPQIFVGQPSVER